MTKIARVVLRKAKTYNLRGKKYYKDVHQIVKGEDVDEFINNGYFYCKLLKAKKPETKIEESEAQKTKKKKLVKN